MYKIGLIVALGITLGACDTLRDFAIDRSDQAGEAYATQYAWYCKTDDRAVRQAWYNDFVKELKKIDPNLEAPKSFDCNQNGIPDLDE